MDRLTTPREVWDRRFANESLNQPETSSSGTTTPSMNTVHHIRGSGGDPSLKGSPYPEEGKTSYDANSNIDINRSDKGYKGKTPIPKHRSAWDVNPPSDDSSSSSSSSSSDSSSSEESSSDDWMEDISSKKKPLSKHAKCKL